MGARETQYSLDVSNSESEQFPWFYIRNSHPFFPSSSANVRGLKMLWTWRV
jgi:hypothetical protein